MNTVVQLEGHIVSIPGEVNLLQADRQFTKENCLMDHLFHLFCLFIVFIEQKAKRNEPGTQLEVRKFINFIEKCEVL